MSDYLHMRHGEKQQKKELMKLLNLSFDFNDKSIGFEDLLPKLYKDKYNPCENNVILDVGGELRAAVGVYYSLQRVCGCEIKAAGIGNVGVHPSYRGEGYMKFCMALAMDDIKQSMADIAFLGGARQRYEPYGFYPTGIKLCFEYTRYNIRHKFRENKTSAYTARLIEESDTAVLNEILTVIESKCFYTERKKDDLYDILRSWAGIPYAVFDKNEFKGWFVLNPEKDSALEIGYKNECDIEDIFLAASELCGEKALKISVPPFDIPLFKFLSENGEDFVIRHAEMFCILNYKKVIKAFLTLKSTYETLADGVLTMLIETPVLPEQIKIEVKDNTVSVTETDDKPDIVLSHGEAMKIVGSNFCPEKNKLPPECASWFPLPLYIYDEDAV